MIVISGHFQPKKDVSTNLNAALKRCQQSDKSCQTELPVKRETKEISTYVNARKQTRTVGIQIPPLKRQITLNQTNTTVQCSGLANICEPEISEKAGAPERKNESKNEQ